MLMVVRGSRGNMNVILILTQQSVSGSLLCRHGSGSWNAEMSKTDRLPDFISILWSRVG